MKIAPNPPLPPALNKVAPLFTSDSPLKVEVLSSLPHAFLELWLEVKTHPPQQKWGVGGGAHYELKMDAQIYSFPIPSDIEH